MADLEKLEKTQKFVMRTLMLSGTCSLLLGLAVIWAGVSELFEPGGSWTTIKIAAVLGFLLSTIGWLNWRVSGELYRGDLEGPRTVKWALAFGIPLPLSFGMFMLGEVLSGSGDMFALMLGIPALLLCALLFVSILRVLFGSALDDLVWEKKEAELAEPPIMDDQENAADVRFDFYPSSGGSQEGAERTVPSEAGESS